jgi:hypothetical protein
MISYECGLSDPSKSGSGTLHKILKKTEEKSMYTEKGKPDGKK